MKTYIKFITYTYLRSFLNIFLIMLGLVFILNLLSELDFFKNLEVDAFVPLYLSMLNSGSLIFEMFPFIFLISTQFFFISFFRNNELEIFKYSGLKNTSIIKILSALTLLLGIFIIVFFYNLSSTFKNIYLDKKSIFTKDNKYLAVITENGLWIKDKIDDKILIINSNKIETNFLIETFITEFDDEFQILRNIKSDKINIKEKDWIVEDARVFIKNNTTEKKNLKIKSNFDYEIIQGLFSNLSSLSILELFKLKENYILLGYSVIEVDVQIQKLLSFPIYLLLMTILSSIIMFNSKSLKNTSIKISIGLFFSVIIYYTNNFFYVLGSTERISLYTSIWAPLAILSFVNIIMINKINEK